MVAFAAACGIVLVISAMLSLWSTVVVTPIIFMSVVIVTLMIRRSDRRHSGGITKLQSWAQAEMNSNRKKQSRHEWRQEQLLERIDRRGAALHVLSARPLDLTELHEFVLFVSSNGAGIGHLTRLTAIAEKMRIPSAFLSLSRAYSVIEDRGHRVSFFASHETVGGDRRIWGARFCSALQQSIRENNARLVVFDGTFVYPELTATCQALGLPLVWIQRGCWKPEIDQASTQRHAASTVASAVILPKDHAVQETVDVGANIDVAEVAPIILTTQSDLLDRASALRELGLNPEQKHVLIQLGAGTINDIENSEQIAVETVLRLSPEWVPVVTRSPLRPNSKAYPSKVKSVTSFPVARHYRAFDFGVFAAGYNSVQESLSLELASVFVPNMNTKTDDQLKRASEAADHGLALLATTDADLQDSIRLLSEDACRSRISAALKNIGDSTGAEEAARFIEQLDARYNYPTSGPFHVA